MVKKKDKGADRGYVRVSTKYESQKDSPENQESFIRERARYEGTELDKVYMDRDSATSIVGRKDVKQMIEDAKNGEVRSLWFPSLSRFSRDAYDAISLKRILVNVLNIRVISIEDGYDSAVKDDELLFGIKSFVNQNTSGDIGGSSRRGIRQSALEKGNIIASKAAYGYKKVNIDGRKTYEIVPKQAAVVELIYNLYIDEGLGDKSIVKYLNGENPTKTKYKSYTGKLWSITTINTILTNPTYTGYNVSGRYKSEIVYDDVEDLMNRKKKLVKTPQSEWEWAKKVTHPPIIPKPRWDRAQEIRYEKGKNVRGGKRKYVNVFAKLIFCKECGSAMVSMKCKSRHDGKEYRYLLCSRNRRIGQSGCQNNTWLPYFDVRDEIIEEILSRVSSSIKQLEKKGLKELQLDIKKNNYDKEKRQVQKQIEDNRKLLFEIRRQHMLEQIDKDQYEFERQAYEKEIMECEQRLEVINYDEKRSMDTQRLIKDAKKALKGLTTIASYNDDVDKTRALLRKVVKGIYASKSGKITVETYI